MARLRAAPGAAALAAGAAALAAAWWLAPAVAPPLYDGCITEPYRLLGTSPAPTSANQHYGGGSGFQPSEVITGESPAQAQILMMAGTFSAPAPFTVSIAPIRPPQPAPSGRRFDGNVYRIAAATTTGSPVEPQPQDPVTIVLRATASNGPTRTIVRLDGSTWTSLKTFVAGCGDEYEAVSTKLGVFATVVAAGASQPSGGFPAAVLIPVIVVVLVAAVVFLLRLNRPVRR
jgi:hypothetical protein